MRKKISLTALTTLFAIAFCSPAAAVLIYEYDAGEEGDTGNGIWEHNIDNSNIHNVGDTARNLTLTDVTFNGSPTTDYPGISASYVFNGTTSDAVTTRAVDGTTTNLRSYGKDDLPLGGTTTNDIGASSTWELWLRPDRNTWTGLGDEVLLETGGTTNGMHIMFTDDSGGPALRFRTRHQTLQGNQPSANVDVTIPLTDDTLLNDFIQIVAVVDAGDEGDETATDAPNENLTLYINGGTLSGGLQNSVVGFADWQDGNSNAAVGSEEQLGGGGNGGIFDGDIAIVRIYDAPLTVQEVAANFNAIVPEPSAFVIVLLGLAGFCFLATRVRLLG